MLRTLNSPLLEPVSALNATRTLGRLCHQSEECCSSNWLAPAQELADNFPCIQENLTESLQVCASTENSYLLCQVPHMFQWLQQSCHAQRARRLASWTNKLRLMPPWYLSRSVEQAIQYSASNFSIHLFLHHSSITCSQDRCCSR